MNKAYKWTINACFIGYIIQAIVNNFVPLLFLTFQSSYGIPLSRITLLITVNFAVQLTVDLVSVTFVDRIGYRASMLIAHGMSALGLAGLTILPRILPSAYAGLLISVVCYAVGGGLLEVLVSPVMESCPTDNKEKAMSMLHSFYCWGQVGVVLFSTLFFRIFGIDRWWILALLWAIVPIANGILFARVPIAPLIADGEKGMTVRELFGMRAFWLLMLMMVCAGASELSVSQWASTFAEKGLGISKTLGDLMGPMFFALLMGCARAFYGKYGEKVELDRFMTGSAMLCVISYLCISLVPVPWIGLLGCGLCGLSVGIMWPGTFSKAAASIKRGGTAMFALLALGGDIGCSGGPTLVGLTSGVFGDNLHRGILAGAIFPIILLVCLIGTARKNSSGFD
ncbi:MAG: MFS transporter [Lachnospiraceae bacterium]|nr:MFS transporter [Lachnospiraceae bacterium]